MEWKVKKLGEIGKVCMCKRIMKHQTSPTGEIPFYKIGTFGRVPDAYIPKEIYEDYKTKYSFPKKGDILISASGTIGRRVIYNGEPAYFQDSNIVWIDNNEKEVLNDYLYKFYGFCDWNPSKGATISRLYNDDLRKISLSYPVSLYEQQQIVEKLDTAFDLIDRAKANIEKNIQNAKELFQSKLNQVFSEKGVGYETKKFSDVCILKSGNTIKSTLEKIHGDIPYLKVADMNYNANKNGFIVTSSRFANYEDLKTQHIIPVESILFPKRGGAILTNKKRFTTVEVIIDLNIMSAIPIKKIIDPKLLWFFFLSFNLGDIANGTTVLQINNYSFDDIKVSFPKSLESQQELVFQLDMLSAQTELLQQKYQQKLTNLEELRKSILEKAFKGKLL